MRQLHIIYPVTPTIPNNTIFSCDGICDNRGIHSKVYKDFLNDVKEMQLGFKMELDSATDAKKGIFDENIGYFYYQ